MTTSSSGPTTGSTPRTATTTASGGTTSASASSNTDLAVADSPLVSEHGSTTIADVVVSKIAGTSAREVDGVHRLGGGAARTLGALRERIPGQKVSLSQGVSVEVGQRQAAVDLVVVVEYGYPIVEVADSVRSSVINAVEHLTGLEVTEVNIAVDDIHLPDDEDDDDTADARVQ